MGKQFKLRTGARGVEWTDKTCNVISGCMHECRWQMPNGDVAVCYAETLAETGSRKPVYPHGFQHHYFHPSRIADLRSGSIPELIFVDSMSDMFASNVPDVQIRMMCDEMRKSPQHAYQSLTKAAPRLLKFLDDIPPNLWVGVSSPPDWFLKRHLTHDAQRRMLAKSLKVLHQVKATTGNIVWMSAEPISWDLTPVITENHPLDWIVIGAASSGRKYFQPNPEYVKSLLEVMDATQTAVFYKGNIRAMFQANDLGTPALNRW